MKKLLGVFCFIFLCSMAISCDNDTTLEDKEGKGNNDKEESDNTQDESETPDKDNGSDDGFCGNGEIDSGEECDGGAANCVDMGGEYSGGIAICDDSCKWDLSSCLLNDRNENDNDMENPDDDNGGDDITPDCSNMYEVTKGEHALYSKGCLYNMQVGSNPFDLYIPAAPKDKKMFVAIYMQGGKVAKEHYSNHSKILSSYGIIVAVPKNDKTLEGANMTENKVFNLVWDHLRSESNNTASPVHNLVEPSKVAVMGHSNGGMAALGIIQNKCEQPTCGITESYQSPPEVAAGVLYGTNTKNPFGSSVGAVNLQVQELTVVSLQ